MSTERADPGRMLLTTLATAGGSFALMQAIIVPALPEVQRDLGASTAWVAWTVSIYLLSAAVATPLLGRLGDQFGKERMLLVTLAAFVAGSLGCIVAWDISSLIVPADARPLVDYGFDATVTGSALLLLPGALVMLPAGPWGGVLGRRIGSRNALVLGMAVTALGAALLAGVHEEPWQLVVAYAIGAAGVAVAFGAMPKLIADAVEPTETGVATGMNTVVRTVGSAIGAQVAVTLLAVQTIAGTAIPAESGFTTSLWLAAAAAVVAVVMALAIEPRRAGELSPAARSGPG